MTAPLTPERLFSEPSLTAQVPADIQFVPGRQALTYRATAADDRERMDLWMLDLATGLHEPWLDARTITGTLPEVERMTAAERAERERRRQFNFGITQYSWLQDGGHLLVPLDGQAYLVAIDTRQARRLTPADSRQSGFTLSPDNNWLSFVRAGDLYVMDIDSAEELRITNDASDTLTNGLPDFLAAEEMHRFEGHWWAPDNRHIAYCRVDDSGVAVSYRLEMEADGTRTIAQRYPYAGAVNPSVELILFNLATRTRETIWRSAAHGVDSTDAYLARVHMGAEGVYIQTQDRLQQFLGVDYLPYSRPQDRQHCFAERSATWINLHDDLRELSPGQFITTDESNDTRHARIVQVGQIGSTDNRVRDLSGPTHINQILEVTESQAIVTGWDTNPTENHLFTVALDGSGWTRLTTEPGWHDIKFDKHTGAWIDKWSNEAHATTVEHVDDDGTRQVFFAERIAGEHPYAPYLDLHSTPEYGTVTAADGQVLHFRLTPPSMSSRGNGQRYPVLLYVYGGPGAQKVRREWPPLLLQMFAQNGYGVLEIDNRGSTNRGRSFEAPLYERLGHVEVLDQLLAFDVLADVDWADTTKVAVFGHSYGGYMTLLCLSQSTRFAAGIAVAPVCDWRLYDSHYTERFMGLPQANAAGYTAANVLTHLDDLNAPLLLMHGMADDNVLFTHSTMIMGRLQQLHKPFELMTYPGAKHSMQERHVSIHRFQQILRFLQRSLPNARPEPEQ